MRDSTIDIQPMKTVNGVTITDGLTVDYPFISMPILLLFCCYIVEYYLQGSYRIAVLGSFRFELLFSVFLLVIAVLCTPKIDTRCPLIPILILFFICVVIQIPFSYDFNTSWNVFVDRVFKFAFISFFIIAFVRSPKHMKFFLGAFLLACMKMGEEGFIGRITGGMIWENQGIMRLWGPTPDYSHPNSFSGMALGTLPFIYFLYPLCNKYLKICLIVLTIFSINIIIYTGSRTGYVGAFAFLCFILVNSKNKRKIFFAYLLAAIIAIPFIPSDYSGRFDSIFTGKDKEGHSTDARKQILIDAWQIFQDHPFGVGVSAFPTVRRETFGRFQDTHNLYFEVATNLGIQGLIVFGILISKLFSNLKKIKSASSRIKEQLLEKYQNDIRVISDLRFIEAVSMATSAFLIIRLTLGLFGHDLYEIYWWFAIGITTSLYSMLERIKTSLDQSKLLSMSNSSNVSIH